MIVSDREEWVWNRDKRDNYFNQIKFLMADILEIMFKVKILMIKSRGDWVN